ncbi:MAG: DUF262 domain-containing protein [Lachnospiraceae bacterium]|nr:DUF262 domain-containing protein [Lachnospiraceae bacterium]
MKIEMYEIPIREVFDGYKDSQENGVVAYGGKLNVRPAFQREFVYKDKQRDEVINTVRKDFPLNVMYWVKSEAGYELLDGQQRTLSICQYLNSEFSIDYQFFHNLTETEKEQILQYKLMVYICEGDDKEKLDWFKIINIAGEKLTNQELRNAIYTGAWLSEAKKYFSKNQCPAYSIASDYMNGTPIRQDYLETVLYWIAEKEDIGIELYMAKHQHDSNATELWLYFQSVMNWVKANFTVYRKEMKGVDWGLLFNQYGSQVYDAKKLEEKISSLMSDEDVTKKAGIYPYVIDGDERHLSIRAFTPKMKREAYERQNGICTKCLQHFEFGEMEGDHIAPWHEGGATTADNCQMLCKDCNRRKSGK